MPLNLLLLLFFCSGCWSYATHCIHHSRCLCDTDNQINCTNLSFDDLQVLKKITTYDYPNLNFLIINGGLLGDLPNSNIFGENVHRNLHTVHFINTGITSFGPETFSGIPGLTSLKLDRNPLRDVKPQSLKLLDSLKSLSLNRIFDADRKNNRQVLDNLFDSPLPHLENVSMRGNELRFDVSNLLCKLPKLERVDLSDNRFESFTFSQHCLASIKRLKLNDNGLIDLPKLATVPIQELILYNNPLDCDWNICENSDTLNLLLNKTSTFCATPAKHRHNSIADLMIEADCDSSSVIENLLLIVALILFISFIVIWWKGWYNGGFYNKYTDYTNYDMVQLAENQSDSAFV